MSGVEALFRTNPSFGWLAVACVLISMELAEGRLRFAWPALAALAPAGLVALQAPIGGWGEIGVFTGLSALASVLSARERKAIRARALRQPPAHGLPTPTAGPPEAGAFERFGRKRRAKARTSPRPATGTAPSRVRTPRRRRARAASPARAAGLVGRTTRSAGEFSNGIGRVLIDRAEWGADLVDGEQLAPDQPVEIIGVSGGVRLRVRALATN